MTFAERLKDLRTDRGLTQAALGKEMSYTREQISALENKRSIPKADVLLSIADYFNVSTDYLLGRTDNPTILGNTDKQRINLFLSKTDVIAFENVLNEIKKSSK